MMTNKLKQMLLISGVISVITSIFGYYLAVAMDGSIAGAMVTVAGFFFAIAFLFSPSDGVLTSRWKKKRIAQNLLDYKMEN